MDLQGWFNFDLLYEAVLEDLKASGKQDIVLVEVGVWKGTSIGYLAKRAVELFGKEHVRVYAVDIWAPKQEDAEANRPVLKCLQEMIADGKDLYEIYNKNLRGLGIRDLIKDIRADAIDAANQFAEHEDGPADFVFLDADHRQKPTCAAIQAWAPYATILAGHDFRLPSVRAAIESALGTNYWSAAQGDCWCTNERIIRMVQSGEQEVMLAIPAGTGGSVSHGTVQGILHAENARRNVHVSISASSALTFNFNQAWAKALNACKDKKITRFVMMHSDIAPLNCRWLDILLDELDEYHLDVLGVAVPIKDARGLTSTALDTDRWRPRRLSMTEIHELPPVFDNKYARDTWGHDLLVNTGLLAIRMDLESMPRNEQLVFGFGDRIIFYDNKYEAEFEPEDWRFSRLCHWLGLRVGVTRNVPVYHIGTFYYGNHGSWGTHETEKQNAPERVCQQRASVAPPSTWRKKEA